MIAIIAGTGTLPAQACKSLLDTNQKFFVIVLFPENNLDLIKQVVQDKAEICVEQFYKAKKILDLLKARQTKQLLLIGKVDKNHLLKKIKLDWLAIKILASLVSKKDQEIMDTLVKYFEKEGMEVIRQDSILKNLLVDPGVLTGKLTPKIQEEIDFGLKVAKDISFYDIGQTVVVKDKMILAIEAIEGTDSCIQRGIELGQNEIVVCKAAHPNQNKKYDLPTLGPNSLKDLQPGQVKAIAWQSSQTFISEKEIFVKKAQELGITLVSV
jgi:UDP-2,3-diacylglucosamine hydrolase